MATKKPFAAVVRHGRMIGAEEQLAAVRCRQAFADVQVDSIGAAARLLIEMGETERGDVVQDPHFPVHPYASPRGSVTLCGSMTSRQ